MTLLVKSRPNTWPTPKRFPFFVAVATKDHSKTSCICVTILTHGDKGGEVHAADRPYLLTDVIAIFEKQRSLVNKPKLFFVQVRLAKDI